jgi:CubicO group peptidase (beta-lactamase class C family)
MKSLSLIDTWPVGAAAAGVVGRDGEPVVQGAADRLLPWASVTKLATSLAVLVAAEEGTLPLETVVTDAGATVRHLLSHSSGLAPERPLRQLAAPATRRIYSNAGYELLADEIAQRAGIDFAAYLSEAVFEPLGMSGTLLDGSPAWGLTGPLVDLLRLAGEWFSPTLVAPATHVEATSVVVRGIDGVLPGFGKQTPCDWGLGPEIRDGKSPHWTAPSASPRTYGHFGRSGSFLWVDPDAGIACAALTDTAFGPWAARAWPELSEAVLAELRAGQSS